MNETLTQLGLKHHTDKAYFHEYTDLYDQHLTPLRDKPIKLLEIGVDRGASVRMWEEYFANGMIYGVDCYDKKQYDTNRLVTCIGDQDRIDSISGVFPGECFDVIIDDGGHSVKQQMNTLVALFDRLLPGGIYILEDLHTSLLDYPISDPTTLKLLTLMQNRETITEEYCIHGITMEQLQHVYNNIKSVSVVYLKPGQPESITSIIYKNK